MPKVAIIYPYYNKKGGIERYTIEISRLLAKKCDLTLVSGDIDGNELFPGLSVLRVPFFKRPHFLASFSFCCSSLAMGIGKKFDLTHAQGGSGFYSDIITAHSCHKAWFYQSLRFNPFFSKKFVLKLLNPFHYLTIIIETLQYRSGKCKKIIAISRSVKDDLMKYFKIPSDKIAVVYNGVNLKEFNPEKRETFREKIRKQHDLTEDDLVGIFVAHEFKRKGLKFILQAMNNLQDKRLKLLVVGKDDPTEFEQIATKLGLASRVRFVGPKTNLAEYYAASDMFIFPTSYEAFGLVITEAMATGLPVIVSKIAGAAEIIKHDYDGLLLQRHDDVEELTRIIRALLDDPKKRKEMGKLARKKAEQFSWENVAQRHLEIYQELIAKK